MATNSSIFRTAFFVSDHSGVTAETMGHSLLSQFETFAFNLVTLPFVDTVEKAHEARLKIDAAAAADGVRPVVFSTLVREAERDVVKQAKGLHLDFFDAFLAPLESELGQKSAPALGRVHGMSDLVGYMARIDATNFALSHDDGNRNREYERADLLLIGVSRTGKTPTCLYMALHYGIYAANYPLTEDDLEKEQLPPTVAAYAGKLFGLTIQPARLQQIRTVRRPESRYASSQQVQYELRAAEQLFQRFNIRYTDTTSCSVEEVSSRILQATGIPRRVRP